MASKIFYKMMVPMYLYVFHIPQMSLSLHVRLTPGISPQGPRAHYLLYLLWFSPAMFCCFV